MNYSNLFNMTEASGVIHTTLVEETIDYISITSSTKVPISLLKNGTLIAITPGSAFQLSRTQIPMQPGDTLSASAVAGAGVEINATVDGELSGMLPLPAELVLQYSYTGSGTAIPDVSGHSMSATCNGGCTVTGGALVLDGTDDYAVSPTSTNLDPSVGISVAVAFTVDAVSQDGGIVSAHDSANQKWQIYVTDEGKLKARLVHTGNSTLVSVETTAILNAGQKYFAIVEFHGTDPGSDIKIFIDGNEQAVDVSGPYAGSYFSGSGTVTLGNSPWSSTDHFLHGSISRTWIKSGLFTNSEKFALFLDSKE